MSVRTVKFTLVDSCANTKKIKSIKLPVDKSTNWKAIRKSICLCFGKYSPRLIDKDGSRVEFDATNPQSEYIVTDHACTCRCAVKIDFNHYSMVITAQFGPSDFYSSHADR
jgi:hypothetical protein